MEPTPDKPEAALQAQARAIRLSNAFVAVFGKAKQRSTDQAAVLAHLELCAGDDNNSYRFNEAKDGLALIAAGIHRDGAKSILKVIDRQIQIAEKLGAPKKAKPTTTR